MKLIGNVHFGNSDDYQAVYSSQLYGTFFMIYAKFELDTKKTTDDEYYLDKIHLKLLNYKGLINIGIANASFKKYDDGGIILVEVQGLCSNSEETLLCVSENAPFSRKIGEESFLKVERRARKFSEDDNTVIKNEVFDEEFYYREGFKFETDPETKLKSLIEQDYDERIVRPLFKGEVVEKAGGTRCPNSLNAVR